MTSTPIKLFAAALLSSISAVLGTTSIAPDVELNQIARYRQWTRATQQLKIAPTIGIDSFSAAGWVSFIDRRVGDVSQVTISEGTTRIRFPDAVLSSEQVRKEKPDNMHASGSPLGAVYVNELAGQAIGAGNAGKFPVGSIIVREKLAKPDDKEPELVAVMIKREPGFNPEGGDWLFLTADGTLAKIRERQKKGSCLACHQSERANDFVFPLTAAK